MAAVTARELRAIVESGRAAGRAIDEAKASVAILSRVADDPHFQREIASAASALSAVLQSAMPKHAAAISVFTGPAITDLSKVADPISGHALNSAGVLGHDAEAERNSTTVAVELGRQRDTFGGLSAISSEITAYHERDLRMAESMRPTAAALAAVEKVASGVNALLLPWVADIAAQENILGGTFAHAFPSLAGVFASQGMVAEAEWAMQPTASQVVTGQDIARQLEEMARPSSDMVAVARRLAQMEHESQTRFAETAAQVQVLSSSISGLRLQDAAQAAMWSFRYRTGRSRV